MRGDDLGIKVKAEGSLTKVKGESPRCVNAHAGPQEHVRGNIINDKTHTEKGTIPREEDSTPEGAQPPGCGCDSKRPPQAASGIVIGALAELCAFRLRGR